MSTVANIFIVPTVLIDYYIQIDVKYYEVHFEITAVLLVRFLCLFGITCIGNGHIG
jgi:hypothetical protein